MDARRETKVDPEDDEKAKLPPKLQPIRLNPQASGQARNHPCPCGSGKKTKRCHGAIEDARVRKWMSEARDESKPKPDFKPLLRDGHVLLGMLITNEAKA